MVEEDARYLFKIVVVGDGSVGKTSLITRFVEGRFSESYIMTIGVSFFAKEVQVGGITVALQIWDMVGQDRFKFMASSLFKGCKGVVLMFDLAKESTFKPSILNWIDTIFKYTGRVPIVLIGNKVDLENSREVDSDSAKQIASKLGCPYIETSAMTGENINEVFQQLTKLLLQHEGIQEKLEQFEVIESQMTTSAVSEIYSKENKWAIKPEQAKILGELESLIKKDIPRVSKLTGEIVAVSVKDDEVEGLVLNNCGLKALPEILCQLKSLETLDLSGNQLNELPNCFGNLESLQELDLSNNQLQTLPENFGNLKLLINLNFYFNHLENLPSSFKELEALEILNLSFNQLTIFPETLLNLTSLQFIGLRNNQLTKLSTGLWKLKQLKDIQSLGNPWDEDWKEIVKNDVPTILDFCRKHDTITVFCSHAEADVHSNLIEIKKLAKYLGEQEEIYKVYYSEEAIQGGMEFEEFMRTYVPISQVLLFFATEKSLNSTPCQFELQLALDNQIPIIPILGPNLKWQDLNQIALNEPTGEPFHLAEVKGLNYFDKVRVFGAELYAHIHELKRALNLFDKGQIQIDQLKLELIELFTGYFKSNEYNSLIKDNFNVIKEIFLKYKRGSLPFQALARKLFEILE